PRLVDAVETTVAFASAALLAMGLKRKASNASVPSAAAVKTSHEPGTEARAAWERSFVRISDSLSSGLPSIPDKMSVPVRAGHRRQHESITPASRQLRVQTCGSDRALDSGCDRSRAGARFTNEPSSRRDLRPRHRFPRLPRVRCLERPAGTRPRGGDLFPSRAE